MGAKKQTAVALLTCEAEYDALISDAQEVIWVKRIFNEAGLKIQCCNIPMRSDSQAAISWAASEEPLCTCAKHMDVRVHFIRELVKKLLVNEGHVPGEVNDADVLTKPFGPAVLRSIMETFRLQGGTAEGR